VSSLYRYLLRHYLVAALAPLVALAGWLSWDLEHRRYEELASELRDRARLAARLIEREPDRVQPLVAEFAAAPGGMRLTVIRIDGTVLADSGEDARRMENHLTRPEVARALAAGEGSATRGSSTLGVPMRYMAVRLDRGGKPWGVVRTALTEAAVRQEVGRLQWTLALAFGLAIAATLLMAHRLSGALADPLDALSRGVRAAQSGKWTQIARLSGPKEIQELTSATNEMIDRLHTLIREAETGRVQLETVLTQMADGLLLLNREGRVSAVNPAGRRMLGLSASALTGRLLLDAVRSYPLDALARRALAGEATEPLEWVSPHSGATLRVLASPLRPVRNPDGAILLIQDLTEIRRIDRMRRDFVTNVSHELKTPIAGLRALAETIVLRGPARPEIAVEYAGRLAGEVERLGRLVEDLLTLSRIESGRWELRPAAVEPARLVEEVAERFREAAEKGGVRLAVAAPELPAIVADRDALGIVLGNLVDNAVKYTPSGGEVRVSAAQENGHGLLFAVEDTGPGIPPEALPRIFERFYRVDPSRSQEIAGTGLGLSIVSHLCEIQGARVWAESEPGKGSRFFVELPTRDG
jgi:two-component system phosphate regulon sensor histidine kinase PhoR